MRASALLFMSVALLAAPPAVACTVSSDPDVTVVPVDPTEKEGANRIVSMSLLPKLMHIDRKSVAGKLQCRLDEFAIGERRYTLWGVEGKNRQRRAIPAKKGDPVAIVITVVDIIKAIKANKADRVAPIDGYLLATVDGSGFTGWRFYTGMPDTARLTSDMVAVLGPDAGKPIFRRGNDNKVTLFVG